MGLAEKRASATVKEQFDGKWLNRIQSAAGSKIPVEVEWETLVKEGTADNAVDAFDKIFVEPLEKAFKEIATDKMGQEALAEGLKKVVIKNSGERYSFSDLSIQNGVLTLDHRITNVDQINERVHALVNTISKAL